MCEETTSTNINNYNSLILIPILAPLIILFIIFLAYEAGKGFSDITFIFKIPKKIMEKKKEKNIMSQELTKYIKEIYAYHDLEALKRFIHTNKIIENKNDEYYQEVSTILKKLGIYEEYTAKMGELKLQKLKK